MHIDRCLWCGQAVVFGPGGWRHKNGEFYAKRCKTCGWVGAPQPCCPECGATDLIDDHAVMVDRTVGDRE